MSPLIDSFHCFFCHLLKENNVKILRRIKNIYQMMRHTVHLFRTNLGGADVHLPVDLHRVSRNDLSADRFGKSDGGSSLPDSSWSGQNDQWAFVCLFHLVFPRFHLYNSFKFLFQITFCHGNDCRSSMRTVIWIVQCQEFADQFIYFLCRKTVIPLYSSLTG